MKQEQAPTTTTWKTADRAEERLASEVASSDVDSDVDPGAFTESNDSIGISSTTNGSASRRPQAEWNVVQKWKFVVFLSFTIAAAFVIAITYSSLSKDEKNEFELAFHHLAGTINSTCHLQARNMMQRYESMANTITSHALSTESVWPFVSIPFVEIHLSQLRNEAYTEFIGFSPIVEARDKELWENYSVKNQNWIHESSSSREKNATARKEELIPPHIHVRMTNTADTALQKDVLETSWGPYAPMWQMSPPPFDVSIVNHNTLSNPMYAELVQAAETLGRSVVSGIVDMPMIYTTIFEGNVVSADNDDGSTTPPHTVVIQPVYDRFDTTEEEEDEKHKSFVGFLEGFLSWESFLNRAILVEESGITLTAVLENPCTTTTTTTTTTTAKEETHSFEIHQNGVEYLGRGDHHDSKFDDHRFEIVFTELDTNKAPPSSSSNTTTTTTTKTPNTFSSSCYYTMNVYPTWKFQQRYRTHQPTYYTVTIAAIFLLTGLTFHIFSFCVQEHQRKLMVTAERTHAVVSALFPQNVQDRVMKDVEQQVQNGRNGHGRPKNNNFFKEAPKQQLKSYLHEEEHQEDEHAAEVAEFFNTKPIADFFPAVTVLFADIVGFTAWSSVREPSQVFQLLETIYFNFDVLAKRRRVFKVETVGDCYVAATGLPDPRNDHAVLMARFARECMERMQELTRKLEETLGPDTGELTMRFGLHSGPVTAGVLRGEKSRFQLFGDTMNTASRIETTGARDRIHISQETADLLIAGGKTRWVTPRENKVVLKGIGEVQTYWVQVVTERSNSMGSSSDRSTVFLSEENTTHDTTTTNTHHVPTEENGPTQVAITPKDDDNNNGDDDDKDPLKKVLDPKMERLVKWNVDQVIKLLKPVVARRNALKQQTSAKLQFAEELMNNKSGSTVLDEVKEIIELPTFDAKSFKSIEDPDMIELSSNVTTQLHDYIRNICKMYREKNPFHNFEHASHVTMSVCKLLSRITAPSDVDYNDEENSDDGEADASTRNFAAALHDHTYGITSDPLTQFAVAFSALIHDVDHSGVPNAQLIKENSAIASLYNNKSVAEQNSVDLAWNLLMTDDYAELRSVIYTNKSEYLRFRQLTVNSVMATDIVDKELKQLRNSRWAKAFSADGTIPKTPKDVDDDRNRKATIVIEHLIQASDVAHTMQHWHIYRKWNERFFREMYLAYKTGRSALDPSVMWYKGEIGFFDFYIIPLARKLKDCGVFGVSSDECLNFALMNRAEWVSKGEFVVAEMLENFTKDFDQGKIPF